MFGKIRRRKKKISRTVEIPKTSPIHITVDHAGIKKEYRIGNAQHIGGRKQQQDSFGFSELMDPDILAQKGICGVLSDGMGGLDSGREISEQVVQKTLEYFKNLVYQYPIGRQLFFFYQQFNQELFAQYEKNGKPGAGATVLTVILFKDRLYWYAVGDSRLYLWRKERLYQINEEHNFRNKLIEKYIEGEGSLEDAWQDPKGEFLTSYMGCPEILKADIGQIGLALQNGDKILMLTDGVYRSLSEETVIEKMKKDPQEACTELIQDAVSRKIPGQDNMTAMAIALN